MEFHRRACGDIFQKEIVKMDWIQMPDGTCSDLKNRKIE